MLKIMLKSRDGHIVYEFGIQKIYPSDYTKTARSYYANKLNMAKTLVLVNKQWFIWSMDN